jgi:hypothetical protein
LEVGKENNVSSLPSRLAWLLGLVALTLGAVLVSGCTLLNKAPVISSLEADKDNLSVAESCEIRVAACDLDGDELSYEWQASRGTILGQSQVAIWTAPHSSGIYDVTVRVSDGRGGEVEGHLSLNVIPNSPPVIENLTAQRTRASRAETIVIECLASDAERDSLAYTWSATGGTFYGSGPITAWEAPLDLGTYTITVEVTDGRGGEASADLTIEVAPNHPPVIESLTPTEWVVLVDNSTDITCTASDPDDDVLSYFWSAPQGELSGEGSTVTWTAAGECGAYVTISVDVFDGRGGETSRTLDIRVRKPG